MAFVMWWRHGGMACPSSVTSSAQWSSKLHSKTLDDRHRGKPTGKSRRRIKNDRHRGQPTGKSRRRIKLAVKMESTDDTEGEGKRERRDRGRGG